MGGRFPFHSGEAARTRALLAVPVMSAQEGRCMGVLCAKPASPSPSRAADTAGADADGHASLRSLGLEQPAVGDLLTAAAQV